MNNMGVETGTTRKGNIIGVRSRGELLIANLLYKGHLRWGHSTLFPLDPVLTTLLR
jgi:hypothetical protein